MTNEVLNERMQAILNQDKSLENDLAMINSLKENLNEDKKGEDNMVEVTSANMAPTTVSDKVTVKVSQVEVSEPPFTNPPTTVAQVTITDPNVNTAPAVQEVVQQQPIPVNVPQQTATQQPVQQMIQTVPPQFVEQAPQMYATPVQSIPVNNPTPAQAVINQPQVQPIPQQPINPQPIQQPVQNIQSQTVMPGVTPAPTVNISQQAMPTTTVKQTSTQTLYKKKAAENLANLEALTIQNWASLSNEIRYENMVKIIGLSSAKVAAALGMQPANRVTQAVRGQRPFKPEIVQIVYNWFMSNEELIKHPQLRSLVTPELFSTPKVK